MTEDERALKLETIRTLPGDQLQAWLDGVTLTGQPWCRAPFAGEVAALIKRAARAGVALDTRHDRKPWWGRT